MTLNTQNNCLILLCKLLHSTLSVYRPIYVNALQRFWFFALLLLPHFNEGLTVSYAIMQDVHDRKCQQTCSPRAETPNIRLLMKVRKENASGRLRDCRRADECERPRQGSNTAMRFKVSAAIALLIGWMRATCQSLTSFYSHNSQLKRLTKRFTHFHGCLHLPVWRLSCEYKVLKQLPALGSISSYLQFCHTPLPLEEE